ncbi:MAG: albusnodin family lasso peptide [Pseudonocardiaceae bacterium]
MQIAETVIQGRLLADEVGWRGGPLGDAVELTLGKGSGNSEDKRYQYN